MRTQPGQGTIAATEKISANFIVDVSASYRINNFVSAFGSVTNIANEVYEVARRPAGLRPGMPRAFQVGIKANL